MAALVALILAVAITGSILAAAGTRSGPATGSPRLVTYGAMIVVPWILVAYVGRVGRPRWVLGALWGRGWSSVRHASGDVVLAIALGAFVFALEATWARVFGEPGAATRALLPSTAVEQAAWVAVALSAGTGEEIVCRGYLQRELAARTRSPSLGIVLQAALFGIAHAERGPGVAARAAIAGAAFGVVALRRRSLVPGVIAHVGIDLASGWIPV